MYKWISGEDWQTMKKHNASDNDQPCSYLIDQVVVRNNYSSIIKEPLPSPKVSSPSVKKSAKFTKLYIPRTIKNIYSGS